MPNLITPAQAATFKTSSEDAAFAVRFLSLFKDGPSSLIKNVQTTMQGLLLGQNLLPVTVNETEYPNSYVCSPYTHYITYALEELPNLRNPILIAFCRLILNSISSVMRVGQLNKNVHINNWLLSTNLYPTILPGELIAATTFLQTAYPTHALIWRSLNRRQHPQLMDELQAQGYRFFFSRQVYLLDAKNPAVFKIPDNFRDARLLARSEYEVIPNENLTRVDFPRITQLYNLLYIDKYTLHNPQFTEDYLHSCWQNSLLTFQVLRHKQTGQIDGVIGYFNRNGTMTNPVFGYDTALPVKTGLYRLINSLAMQKGADGALLINLSAGAAHFKRLRGGEAQLEYSAVKYNHLPFRRRLAWNTLYLVLNRLAVPLMEKYRL